MKTLILCVALAIYAATCWPNNAFNEQTRTADAWLRGTMNIDAPDSYIEHAAFEGRKYALHPPLSAAVMVPFVAVWGPDANQVWVAVLLGAVDVVLVWMLLGKIGGDANALGLSGSSDNASPVDVSGGRIYLTAFFAFGTSFWYEAAKGDTWALPSVVGMLFTLLALHELFGRRRGWLLGLWAGLAALGQYQYAFVIPLYFLMLSGWLPASRSPQPSISA